MNWLLLINSLAVAMLTAFCATMLGVVAAVFLCALPARWQKLSLVLGVTVMAFPPFLVTNTWLDLLGAYGILRPWIAVNLFTLGGTVWILTLMLWPVPFAFAGSCWLRLDAAQLEVDPALRGGKLFRWLLWPMARTSILLGGAIVFVLALNNFAVPAILQVKVLPADTWVAFNTHLNPARTLVSVWPLILLPVLLLVAFRRATFRWPRTGTATTPRVFRRQLGNATVTWLGLVFTCLVGVGIFAPLLQLGLTRRSWTEFLPAAAAGLNALGNSVWYAGSTAILTSFLGVLGWRLRGFGFMWIFFLVPGVLLGIALTYGFSQPSLNWLYRTALIVMVALVMRYFAIAWAASRSAMRGLDPDLEDAARVEGARGWMLFARVQWPQIAPRLLAAGYIIYLLALWDVETLLMIVPPGGETLAMRIFNLLHYGHNAQVNALCLLLLLVALAPLMLFGLLRAFRSGRRTQALLVPVLLLMVGCSRDSSDAARIESSMFASVEIIGSRGTGPGQFNKPRSLALDRDDNLFVVDMTGRVQKFSPRGEFLLSWQMPETDLGKAKGMDRDADGNIVVIEPHYQRVNHFTPEGKLVSQWGTRGTNCGELTLPRAVAVDSTGNVVVGEYTVVDRVQKFSKGGTTLLACWGTPGLRPGELNRPEGVAVDPRGNIYVADSCNHRVQVFDPTGRWMRAYGRAGSGRGELSYPYDIRLDAEGRQYVCEFGNSRVQVFDANDQPIEIVGKAGSRPGEFSNPWSIAFDSKGNLYVADSQNHRVQKLVRKSHQELTQNFSSAPPPGRPQ